MFDIGSWHIQNFNSWDDMNITAREMRELRETGRGIYGKKEHSAGYGFDANEIILWNKNRFVPYKKEELLKAPGLNHIIMLKWNQLKNADEKFSFNEYYERRPSGKDMLMWNIVYAGTDEKLHDKDMFMNTSPLAKLMVHWSEHHMDYDASQCCTRDEVISSESFDAEVAILWNKSMPEKYAIRKDEFAAYVCNPDDVISWNSSVDNKFGSFTKKEFLSLDGLRMKHVIEWNNLNSEKITKVDMVTTFGNRLTAKSAIVWNIYSEKNNRFTKDELVNMTGWDGKEKLWFERLFKDVKDEDIDFRSFYNDMEKRKNQSSAGAKISL